MTKAVATFSIVAFDPETDSLGAAVQSKFLAVGALVPYARAGVGAVATQALANVTYGPRALELLAWGKTVSETIELLTEHDQQKALRQVGIVDSRGHAAAFTGEDCHDWAGSLTGEHYAIQGNILAGGSSRLWRAPTRRATKISQGDCWRRWKRGRRREETPGASSRRPSS